VRRLRFVLVLIVLTAMLVAACGGGDDGEDASAVSVDALELRSESVTIGAQAVEEKRGLFGPALGFVLRLPEEWNGRLLLSVQGAGGTAGDLDTFAARQVAEETAYAPIDSSDALEAPAIYEQFLAFVSDQAALTYGRAPEQRYLQCASQRAGRCNA
jgi:hypothetical protein